MQDSSGRTTYAYDVLSRMTSVVDRTGSRLTYTYDAIGQPRSLQSSSGLFTYTFDAAGRTIGFRNPLTTWTYDAAGRTIVKRNGNGTRVSYTYDNTGRATIVTNLNSSNAVVSDYANRYDKVGNRTQIVDVTGNVTTYNYDRAYQLVGDIALTTGVGWSDLTLAQWSALTLDQWSTMTLVGSGTGSSRNTYTYDPVGNRLALTRADGTRATYSYDAANQMTRFLDTGAPFTFTYDQSGNPLLQKNTASPFNITLTWDAENRLATDHQKGVASGNAFDQRLTHTYNGDGQRVERDGGAGNARFVRDGNNIHLKLDLSNTLIDSYSYEPLEYGKLICTGSQLFQLYDSLGSSTAMSNNSGVVTDTYVYDSWGMMGPQNVSSAVIPFLFVGRLGYYTDDEGRGSSVTSPLLPYSVGSRFYQANWARWVNQDPLRLDAAWLNVAISNPSPDMLLAIMRNGYSYVTNNPVNVTDPSGLHGFPGGGSLRQCPPPPPCNKGCSIKACRTLAQQAYSVCEGASFTQCLWSGPAFPVCFLAQTTKCSTALAIAIVLCNQCPCP